MQRTTIQNLLDFVAANVRRLRARQQLTQEALAELAGMDARFLQRVERGQVNMRLETLLRLAEALGVPLVRLLRRASLPAPTPGRPRIAAARRRRSRSAPLRRA